MARRLVAGCVRCPWCPRTFWIDAARGRRALGAAVGEFGRHARKSHGKSLEQGLAELRERTGG